VLERPVERDALLLGDAAHEVVEPHPRRLAAAERLAVLEGGVELDRQSRPQVVDLAHPVRQRLKRRLDRALCLIPADPGRLRDGRDQLVLGDRAIDVSCHTGSAAAGSQLTSGGSGCGAIDVM
jgi:hypothetical protein